MNNVTHHLLVLTSALTLTTTAAHAWDFSYGYKDIFAANADQYIVGQQTVRKYSEWQSPPETYWGPSANDTATTLTLRFNFTAPTSELFLMAQTFAGANAIRGDYGSCSLWASTDGASWQLLLNNAPSGTTTTQLYYNQDVPGSLVGSTSFWLQARMQEHGALTTASDPAATWADAQFSRLDPGNPGNVFQLNAALVPEPGTFQLAVGGLVTLLGLSGRARLLGRRMRL